MTEQLFIRRPSRRDEARFLAAVRRSRKLHRPWVGPLATAKAFRAYFARQRSGSHAALLVFLLLLEAAPLGSQTEQNKLDVLIQGRRAHRHKARPGIVAAGKGKIGVDGSV